MLITFVMLRLFMRRFSTLFLLLLLAGMVYADSPPLPPSGEHLLALTHLQVGGSTLANKTVFLIFRNSLGQEQYSSALISPDATTRTELEAGDWMVRSGVVDSSTGAKSFAAQLPLHFTQDFNASLYYIPVGSLKLLVEDSGGHAVPQATVNASCLNQFYSFGALNGPVTQTDESGSIVVSVPSGVCVFTAFKGGEAGSKSVTIPQGAYIEQTLALSPVAQDGLPYWLPGVLALALLAAGFFLIRRSSSKPPSSPPAMHPMEHSPPAPSHSPVDSKTSASKEYSAVYRTLSEHEKAVMDALVSSGKMKQSKLFATLLIPKTSLIRTINTLQTKGLVSAQPWGNTRMVELAEWIRSPRK